MTYIVGLWRTVAEAGCQGSREAQALTQTALAAVPTGARALQMLADVMDQAVAWCFVDWLDLCQR